MVKRRTRKSSDLADLRALMSMRVQIWPPRLLGRRKGKPKPKAPLPDAEAPTPSVSADAVSPVPDMPDPEAFETPPAASFEPQEPAPAEAAEPEIPQGADVAFEAEETAPPVQEPRTAPPELTLPNTHADEPEDPDAPVVVRLMQRASRASSRPIVPKPRTSAPSGASELAAVLRGQPDPGDDADAISAKAPVTDIRDRRRPPPEPSPDPGEAFDPAAYDPQPEIADPVYPSVPEEPGAAVDEPTPPFGARHQAAVPDDAFEEIADDMPARSMEAAEPFDPVAAEEPARAETNAFQEPDIRDPDPVVEENEPPQALPQPAPKPSRKSKARRKTRKSSKVRKPQRSGDSERARRSVSLYHSLTFRIAILNTLGLVVFLVGLLGSTQFRTSLVNERVKSLEQYSRLIAGVLERSALRPRLSGEAPYEQIDMDMANNVLRRVVLPVTYRARIYDTNYDLIADSKLLSGQIPARPIAEPGQPADDLAIVKWMLDILVNTSNESRLTPPPRPGEFEFPEVSAALRGTQNARELHGIRRNESELLEVSVARPLKRLHAHVGVLLLTNEGEDFDRVARADWKEILRVAAMAFGVNLLLAIFYAQTIVRPIRKLVSAANRIRTARGKPGSALAAEIPGFRGRGDEIGRLAGSFNDMTKALTLRLDAIEKFAADVSHEIKNPLTSMRSAIETMDLAKTEEAKGRLMDVLKHDVDRLDRLITDISDASRLDAELSREAAGLVDIATLLRDVARIYSDTMEITDGPPVTMAVEVDGGAAGEEALKVSGLEGRLGQVLRNLIDNAISFSPPGGRVLLTAGYQSLDRSSAMVVITIEDDGPGIPEDNLETIFRRFYTERPYGDFGKNSGLGLSISKQIIEVHGGQIFAANKRDEDGEIAGACFTVQLPAAAGSSKRAAGRGEREPPS